MMNTPLPKIAMLTLLVLSGCNPAAEKLRPQNQLTVEYTLDRDTIHVGDPVELIVTAYFPTNGVLDLPEIGREKEIVLLGRNGEDLPRKDGLSQSETRYRITSFRLGEHRVSTGMIACVVGHQTFSTPFPPVILNVETTLAADASAEITDIKPVHKLPGRIPRWVWMVFGVAACAVLIGWLSSKLWKHRETILPKSPPVPPHILAFRALEKLHKKGLLEKNECNPFYTELSLILRTYLEGRFQLNAPDETTEEIIEELSTSPDLSGTQHNILQAFMHQADMVKFAKGHPDRTTMERAFETTKQFVEETSTKLETGNWEPETP